MDQLAPRPAIGLANRVSGPPAATHIPAVAADEHTAPSNQTGDRIRVAPQAGERPAISTARKLRWQ